MFNLYKYKLPFRQIFKTTAGSLRYRKGVILRYRDSATDLLSEAAPLPGFSAESLPEVINVIKRERDKIHSFFSDDFNKNQLRIFTDSLPPMASLQFAISSLGLFILASRSGGSLSSYLDRPLQKKLSVNAVVGTLNKKELKHKIVAYYQQGFRVVKCKVTSIPGHLPQTLSEIAEQLPDIHFRLDANRSWPMKKVSEFSEQFRHLPVEYLEEPSRLTEINQYKNLLSSCSIPVAADESIQQFGLSAILDLDQLPSYFIIKPMFLGNLIDLFATITRQDHLEDRVVFTTALESVVGRRIVACIAGMYGSKLASHGLNTGILFSDDLASDPINIDGAYNVNESNSNVVSFQSLHAELLENLF